jgi:hypothetical protein
VASRIWDEYPSWDKYLSMQHPKKTYLGSGGMITVKCFFAKANRGFKLSISSPTFLSESREMSPKKWNSPPPPPHPKRENQRAVHMLELKSRIPKHVKHNHAIFEISKSREL